MNECMNELIIHEGKIGTQLLIIEMLDSIAVWVTRLWGQTTSLCLNESFGCVYCCYDLMRWIIIIRHVSQYSNQIIWCFWIVFDWFDLSYCGRSVNLVFELRFEFFFILGANSINIFRVLSSWRFLMIGLLVSIRCLLDFLPYRQMPSIFFFSWRRYGGKRSLYAGQCVLLSQ